MTSEDALYARAALDLTRRLQQTEQGRADLTDRIAAIRRHGDPVTSEQRAAAEALLADLLTAAAQHGVTLDDFDWTIDLPGGCLDVVLAKSRLRT